MSGYKKLYATYSILTCALVAISGYCVLNDEEICGCIAAVAGLGTFSLSLLYLMCYNVEEELGRVESRIDFLEDVINNHAEVIDENRDFIIRIQDFLMGDSEEPRAEKKDP